MPLGHRRSTAPGAPAPTLQRADARPAALIVAAAIVWSLLASALAPTALAATGTYRNPLEPVVPGDGIVESCADPTVIRGQEGEGRWYMYCTTDPLNDEDRDGAGNFNFRLVPMLSSTDLVNWVYEGDAFTTRPAYATPTAGLWAPEIMYYPETGNYHLYYTVVDTIVTTTNPNGPGSAIGVATAPTPLGPWTHAAAPVIEPHAADCCPGSRRNVFDPEVLRTAGPDYIYYGSYFGGVSVRLLSEDGLTSTPIEDGDPNTGTMNVGVANKFEGPEVEFRDGWYYLFVSATDCCRGPLTGYAVFVGRSQSPLGPFLDRSGVSLNENEGPNEADPTDARAGGTPVIYATGNRWVGPGHNTVFQDLSGQWWTIYHAIDINEPYFEGAVGFTKRPAMLDAIDWVNGWPTLNGGAGISDTPKHAPAAQPGDKTNHKAKVPRADVVGTKIAGLSDEFNDTSLSGQWSWVREPAAGTYQEADGVLRFDTQAADLHESQNSASVLIEDAPDGNYVVETRVRVTVPDEGCCFNFVQAGLVVYGDDDNYIKLTNASIWNTRQTEFAKEVGPVPAGYPRYGNTVVGPPGEWTWLRIVKRDAREDAPGGLYGGDQAYTAYTSRDGIVWERGATWLHHLGDDASIGLVSMGGSGFTAHFDYVRVSRVHR
jgi:arabinan endo-1,5-alpha-L-arabinosidase